MQPRRKIKLDLNYVCTLKAKEGGGGGDIDNREKIKKQQKTNNSNKKKPQQPEMPRKVNSKVKQNA